MTDEEKAIADHEEKQELMRRAAQNLLDHAALGRKCDPHGLMWARTVLSRTKLPTPGKGEPA